jgi:hypothetical protein
MHASIKPVVAPVKIRRVAVTPFEGTSGAAVSNDFVRQLLAAGLEVSAQAQDADAIFSGEVLEYRPSDKVLVYLGNTPVIVAGGSAVTVTNPVVSLTSAAGNNEGPAPSRQSTQIVSVIATVSAKARLTEAKTGRVVWTDEYGYESLDSAGASQTVATVLVRSLRHSLRAERPSTGGS